MENRCPNCGYKNEPYATKCEKCGNSLSELLKIQRSSLMDVRMFSIIYLIVSAIGTASFIYNELGFGRLTFGYFSNVPNITPGQVQSAIVPELYILEIFSVVSAIISLVAIYFLRSGYKRMYKYDRELSTPLTGTTLVFVGLLMVVIGVIVLIALLASVLPGLLQNPPVYNVGALAGLGFAGILVVLGAILLLIGVILAILLGLHKLGVKFDEGMFDAAWILYLISVFFQPIGLIASYLSFEASRRTIRRIDEAMGRLEM